MLAVEKIETRTSHEKRIDQNFLSIFSKSLPPGNEKWRIQGNDRGHVYTGSLPGGQMEQNAALSREQLKTKADEKYVTAASFWHPKRGRTKENLRWIHSLCVDIDVPKEAEEIDHLDLCVCIADAGLPAPSMMVRTPSGGIHVWWFLSPVRAMPRAIRLFEALQESVAREIGGDVNAVGAERLWRMPSTEAVIFSSQKKHKLSVFRKWRDENRPQDILGVAPAGGKVFAFPAGLLRQAGVKKVLQGVEKGQRNDACFSLAVCHLLEGFSSLDAEKILAGWNEKNSVPLPLFEIQKCVRSAEKGLKRNQQHYFNAARKRIWEITGEKIKYRHITPPKPRDERKRSHISEWEGDILELISGKGGKICANQTRLAKKLGAGRRSICMALKNLEKEGKIKVTTIKKGRKSVSIITLIIPIEGIERSVHTGTHYGGGSLGARGKRGSSEADTGADTGDAHPIRLRSGQAWGTEEGGAGGGSQKKQIGGEVISCVGAEEIFTYM